MTIILSVTTSLYINQSLREGEGKNSNYTTTWKEFNWKWRRQRIPTAPEMPQGGLHL